MAAILKKGRNGVVLHSGFHGNQNFLLLKGDKQEETLFIMLGYSLKISIISLPFILRKPKGNSSNHPYNDDYSQIERQDQFLPRILQKSIKQQKNNRFKFHEQNSKKLDEKRSKKYQRAQSKKVATCSRQSDYSRKFEFLNYNPDDSLCGPSEEDLLYMNEKDDNKDDYYYNFRDIESTNQYIYFYCSRMQCYI